VLFDNNDDSFIILVILILFFLLSNNVFLLNHIDQKLTVLPVHQLLDIMTLS
jgi:hypothetical protein